LGAGVAGNGGSSNALKVGLNTGTAGVYSGSAALALASRLAIDRRGAERRSGR